MVLFSLKWRNCPQHSSLHYVSKTILQKTGKHIGWLSSEKPKSHRVPSFDCVGNATMAPFVGCPVPSDLPEPMPLHVFAKEKPLDYGLGQKSQRIWHCKIMALLFFSLGNVSKYVPNALFCDCNYYAHECPYRNNVVTGPVVCLWFSAP